MLAGEVVVVAVATPRLHGERHLVEVAALPRGVLERVHERLVDRGHLVDRRPLLRRRLPQLLHLCRRKLLAQDLVLPGLEVLDAAGMGRAEHEGEE